MILYINRGVDMETKKIGYVAAIFTVISSIIIFLILINKIKIDTSQMLLGTTSFTLFVFSGILLFFGFSLLTNMEHTILAIIDIIVAFLYAGVIILFMVVNKEDALNFYKILIYSTEAIGTIIFLTIPFLVRTQSNLHRYFKYGIVVVIAITSFLSISVINSYIKILDSKDSSMLTTYSEKQMKEMEALQNKTKIVAYGGLASFIGILCNPMIAYASSDGLGGGGSSKTPKLVSQNVATDPTMANGINQNQGINYGDMPVPEGVVANQPIVDSPPITESLNQIQENISSQPLDQVYPSPVVEEQNTNQPSVQEGQAPNQSANLNASDVAPELQFLLNNNEKK